MIDTSPRYAIHPAHVQLRRAARNERAALVQALGIEADWRYHGGPEWAGRYWEEFGDLEQTRVGPADQQRQIAAVIRRRRRPACSQSDAGAMRALFRHLLACLHPDVNPEAACDARAEQWAAACFAYRRGDFDALKAVARTANAHAYANGLRLGVTALRREYRRLACMRKAADCRLVALSGEFPYCLRDTIDDAAWVARQRRVWRHTLAIAAPERLASMIAASASPSVGRERVS